MTDSKGMIWQSYRYDGFGNITFGKPQYNNMYSYAKSSPLNYIDPSGHVLEELNNAREYVTDWMAAKVRDIGNALMEKAFGEDNEIVILESSKGAARIRLSIQRAEDTGLQGDMRENLRKAQEAGDGKGAGKGDSESKYSGELQKVDNPDAAADALANRIGGESRVKFSNDPSGREFDVVSNEFIAQAKPDLRSYGRSWRNQTKATFEAAKATGRKAYFQFEGSPADDILRKIAEYGEIWC